MCKKGSTRTRECKREKAESKCVCVRMHEKAKTKIFARRESVRKAINSQRFQVSLVESKGKQKNKSLIKRLLKNWRSLANFVCIFGKTELLFIFKNEFKNWHFY